MTDQLERIEVTIAELEQKVKLFDALEALEKNRSFKLLIKEQFLKEHMLNMVTLASSPQETVSKGAMNAICAKGALESYFGHIYRDGLSAKEALEEYEAMRLAQLGAEE